MKSWFKWIAGLVLALVALVLAQRHATHRKRQQALEAKAEAAGVRKDVSVDEARSYGQQAHAEQLRADAALEDGQARIKRLEATNPTLAERVKRMNERLR